MTIQERLDELSPYVTTIRYGKTPIIEVEFLFLFKNYLIWVHDSGHKRVGNLINGFGCKIFKIIDSVQNLFVGLPQEFLPQIFGEF